MRRTVITPALRATVAFGLAFGLAGTTSAVVFHAVSQQRADRIERDLSALKELALNNSQLLIEDAIVTADQSALGGAIEPSSLAAALATPCATEDSVNCYWRADLRGNVEGRSFVNVEGHQFPLDSVLEG